MPRRTKSCCSPLCPLPAGRGGGWLIFLLTLLLLPGCSARTSRDDNLRIGVALYAQDDTFISTVAQNLEWLAQEAENRTGQIGRAHV